MPYDVMQRLADWTSIKLVNKVAEAHALRCDAERERVAGTEAGGQGDSPRGRAGGAGSPSSPAEVPASPFSSASSRG